MIGVIVPAHDEARLISDCLESIDIAATHPALQGEPVLVVVAADACGDQTAALARAAGASVVVLNRRNVGSARRAATAAVISCGARWIASTDADSLVAPDWLAQQVTLRDAGVDAVCGVVEVGDWLDHSLAVQAVYGARYSDLDGHPHIHGACLGFSRQAYLAVGGWQRLSVHEDVALIEAMAASGFQVSRSAAVRATTSARRDARTVGGFGDFLATLAVPA